MDKKLEQTLKNCIAGKSMLVFIGEKPIEIQKDGPEKITFDEMVYNLVCTGVANYGDNVTCDSLEEGLTMVYNCGHECIAIVHKDIWSS